MLMLLDASQVKCHLKDHGYTLPVRVRRTSNPFTGETWFNVCPSERPPEGSAILTSSGSREETRWFSGTQAGRDWLAKVNLTTMRDALKNTNAIACTR